MIHVFKTADEPENALVMHRNFDGEHEYSEACWCQPEVIRDNDLRSADEIEEALERVQA